MAEVLNDLKLAALNISGTSNASPQPSHSDGSVTFTGTRSLRVVDSGRMHFCATNGATSTLTLPATSDLSLGDRYTLVQNATPEAQVLVVRTASSSDTFSDGSYLVNSNAAADGNAAELVQPGNATSQALFVRNAATNAAHGIGSTIDCQVVAPNKWLLLGRAEPLGTGLSGASNYQWTDAPTHL